MHGACRSALACAQATLCFSLYRAADRAISDANEPPSDTPQAQTIIRRISVSEIRESISNGEIIEDYPEDKYGPSCLIHGKTAGGKAIHVQCSYPSRQVMKIITVYEPDPERWINFKVRRSS